MAHTARTAILVKKTLTAQPHEIQDTEMKHAIVEVLPTRKNQQSLYLANLYSPPREQLLHYDHFVRDLRKNANGNRLVVVWGFIAPHAAWGYPNTTKKGARVHDAAQRHGFSLWNDLLQPTRLGNRVSRDTNPDLTFTRDVRKATWTRLPDTLGSDYHIIQIEVEQSHRAYKTGKARLTDCKAYRNELDNDSDIEDVEAWLNGIIGAADGHTRTIQLDEDYPAVDNHLLHLWEARRSLLKRWRRQKLNRKLQRRIALLSMQAQEYAEQLNYGVTKEQLLQELQTKLHGSDNPQTTATNFSTPREHQGAPNEKLDRPFTQAELQAALSRLTPNASPGKDRVTNKHLRQLPPRVLTGLLRCYNDRWIKGELPTAWKHSEVTMVPKPNKPISIANLRLISLTSCAGKLFEHMVNERLTTHLEENDRYPHTMFGFCQMLSTQDVLFQLKEDILDHLSKHSKSSILALDVIRRL
ncbi:uncharacterized protein LOC142574946 [Dermacentor variabilis]|uniref:uncharacterized protein LOC142574946 n=1 Tax=Dermacentor variabilis TaxID=34621 RepID=UPI003F5BFBE1